MSVAAQTHFSRPKRAFEEEAREHNSPASHGGLKRVRVQRSPSAGRCINFLSEHQLHASQSSLSVLHSLFPDMEEQTLLSVLNDCGDNIDAAIKRLGQLRLVAEDAGTAGAGRGLDEAGTSRVEDETAASPRPSGPQTPDEWVDVLVQEMAAAKDVADARGRAAQVLGAFNKFATEQSALADPEKSAILSKLQELQKENHILKRAVQIQNSKLQEKQQHDQEVEQLRMMLGQYQEQVRTLQMNNYSLALHLQQATNGAAVASGNRPPDVF